MKFSIYLNRRVFVMVKYFYVLYAVIFIFLGIIALILVLWKIEFRFLPVLGAYATLQTTILSYEESE